MNLYNTLYYYNVTTNNNVISLLISYSSRICNHENVNKEKDCRPSDSVYNQESNTAKTNL